MAKQETPNLSFEINLEKFTNEMRKELNRYEARVGILAEEKHEDSDFTNAELAAVHEFGSLSGNIPARSFFALTEKVKGKEMAEFVKSQEENIIKRVITKDTKKLLKRMGSKWYEFIMECFDTEGWGQWPEWKPGTKKARDRKRFMEGQGGGKMLDDTGIMVGAITHEVTDATTT